MRHWLMKSEPDAFSLADLQRKRTSSWDGVRNYQARNNMRLMAVGDPVLFYHSSGKPTGIAGQATVVRAAYPDHTAWDPASKYFDAKSTPQAPRWDMVDVAYVATFPRLLTLTELRGIPELQGMVLLENSRLSVQPVTPEQHQLILELARAAQPQAAPLRPARTRR